MSKDGKSETPFAALNAAAAVGAQALFSELQKQVAADRAWNQLFELMLIEKRFQMGLPLTGDLIELQLAPQDLALIEEHYAQCCRKVGELFLEDGDLVGAWPFYKTLGDLQALASALDLWAEGSFEQQKKKLEPYVELALGQGVAPIRGLEVLVEHEGIAAGLQALDKPLPIENSVHRQLLATLVGICHRRLRKGITERCQQRGEEGVGALPLIELFSSRPWLYDDALSNIDEFELAGVVYAAHSLSDPQLYPKLIDLCVYGMHRPPLAGHESPPPFSDLWNDLRIYYSALAGLEVEQSLEHFQAKLIEQSASGPRNIQLPAEVYTTLLYRCGFHQQAVATFVEYLRTGNRLTLCPSLNELCIAAGDFSVLREVAERSGNTLQYAVACLEEAKRASEQK